MVFGKTDSTTVEVSDLRAGVGGFLIGGVTGNALVGHEVASAGDINGDGLADMLVSAQRATVEDYTIGKVYVVYGKTSGDKVDLNQIDKGIGGFSIAGDAYVSGNLLTSELFSTSVSAAGDLNGDGFDDLLLGAGYAPSGEASEAGKVYVLFGGQQFASGVDFLGTVGNDTLTGVSGTAEMFVGNLGNDTIIGNGGADVMMGGAGNDTFVLDASNIMALQNVIGAGGNTDQLARINGGTGVDVISLASGADLDLTNVSNSGASTPSGFSRIESVEVIDMGADAGANTLKLALADVLDMTGMNLFNNANGWLDGTYNLAAGGAGGANPESKHQLVIKGGSNDTLDIDSGVWGSSVGNVVHEGTTYNVYNSGLYAQLLVQDGVQFSSTQSGGAPAPFVGVSSAKITGISADTGVYDNDFVTADNAGTATADKDGKLTIYGTVGGNAEGATVKVFVDNVQVGTTLVNNSAWSFDYTPTGGGVIADGYHPLRVTVVDAASKQVSSDTVPLIVDTKTSTQYSTGTPSSTDNMSTISMAIMLDSVSEDSGAPSSDFTTTDNGTPWFTNSTGGITFKGTASANTPLGSVVEVSVDGVVVGHTKVTYGLTLRNWTFEWQSPQGAVFADGTYEVKASLIDVAGNAFTTTTQSVTIDTSSYQRHTVLPSTLRQTRVFRTG